MVYRPLHFCLKIQLVILLGPFVSLAQNPKTYTIQRTDQAPKINGMPDEAIWRKAAVVTDFVQFEPIEDAVPTQRSEVRLLYDNTAIYVSAILYDANPDSVLRPLGMQDNIGVADRFSIAFDTYSKAHDAYFFTVSASGVQFDERISDPGYNTVWESAAKMREDGWSLEIKIPYSAIRFPASETQEWGMHIQRVIGRSNERIRWTSTSKSDANFLTKWGRLEGLNGIQAPLRLSVTPYLTTAVSIDEHAAPDSRVSQSLSGGMGLRYGIDESFTLDATLLPDFSQVRSDDPVKNLSAFEVLYDEQRPFFLEGTELFSKGGVFYSRRIGRTPERFYSATDELQPGEKIKKNPSQAKLLNATKLSGRTQKGLGIGVLNAVLDNTYAIAEDDQGNERKILTEPSSNYNILVFDKQLNNGSSAYFVNGNMMRSGTFSDANVTGAGITLNNKKNTYSMDASGVLTRNFLSGHEVQPGFKYSLGLGKISGKLRGGIFNSGLSSKFDGNSLGITQENNFYQTGCWVYHDQYEPRGKLNNTQTYLMTWASHNFADRKLNSLFVHTWKMIQLRSFYSFWAGAIARPLGSRDHYEARATGRVLMRPATAEIFAGGNTDQRKKFTFYTECTYGRGMPYSDGSSSEWLVGRFNPKLQAGNRFTCDLDVRLRKDNNSVGYFTTQQNGNIIFANRDIGTTMLVLSANYFLRNNLSLSCRTRHYWVTGRHELFYLLDRDGYIHPDAPYPDADFSYSAFGIDSALEWRFAPGSTMSLVWKDSITNESNNIEPGLVKNLQTTLGLPQQHTISLRVLYYFDSVYLKGKNKRV